MRLTAIILGMAFTALSSAAVAQTAADGQADVTGAVANVCVLGAPSPASINLGDLSSTSGTRAGKLATISDQTVNLPGSYCNFGGTRLSISSTALLAADASAPPAGFTRAVNFTSTVGTWGAPNAQVATNAAANGSSATANGDSGVQPDPRQTNLSLQLSAFSAPGDGFLVTGAYAGSVTITLGPE
jgi:hypothetical protein